MSSALSDYARVRRQRQDRRRRRLVQFADLIADGYTIKAAASMIGVSEFTGTDMMRQMRRELGPQAQ